MFKAHSVNVAHVVPKRRWVLCKVHLSIASQVFFVFFFCLKKNVFLASLSSPAPFKAPCSRPMPRIELLLAPWRRGHQRQRSPGGEEDIGAVPARVPPREGVSAKLIYILCLAGVKSKHVVCFLSVLP